MTLYINTSPFGGLHFALINTSSDKATEFAQDLEYNQNFKTSQLLTEFMSANNASFTQLEKIIVCIGPGSFSGIRVGVSLAMGLSTALAIPLFGISSDKQPSDLEQLNSLQLDPVSEINYGKKPNVT